MNSELITMITSVICFVGLCIYVVKVKGKDALIRLIERAEYIFDWEGSGKEKLQYVLDQKKEKIPMGLRWLFNTEYINRMVDVLQKEFKETKEKKKEVEEKRGE